VSFHVYYILCCSIQDWEARGKLELLVQLVMAVVVVTLKMDVGVEKIVVAFVAVVLLVAVVATMTAAVVVVALLVAVLVEPFLVVVVLTLDMAEEAMILWTQY
jgi:hypothetical protein